MGRPSRSLTFLAAVDDVFTAGTSLELLLALTLVAFHLAFATSFGVRSHGIEPSSGVAV